MTTTEREELILRLHDEGLPRREIAEAVGCTPRVVYHVLYVAERVKTTKRVRERREQVEAAGLAGLTAAETVEEKGIPLNFVLHDKHNLRAIAAFKRRHRTRE